MVFSSLVFLFFFLPLTLLVYFISPWKIKNTILLIVSLIFYAWGEPVYIVLMIFSALVDYFHGIIISKNRIKTPWKARAAIISSLVINILLLSFFKYADFLIENINLLIQTDIASLNLALPIGLSFYTFQTMSYTIDVYRGEVEAQKNPFTLALYVCLFPQLIAGPIVRYELIAEELENRKTSFNDFAAGARQFTIGLGKKVLLANNIGLIWSEISSGALSELSLLGAWLGAIAFGFQIYYDFSGYSDMAIGLGRIFGFTFPQNFNYPYMSKSITEFWRRWHMTLGRWFRDYVYIPLGGNRVGKFRWYLNILIVWGLTGLWHGASWNFVLWGLYFGIILILEKNWILSSLKKIPSIFSHLYFMILITVSWPLFYFEDVVSGLKYSGALFGLGVTQVINDQFLYLFSTNGLLLLITGIGAIPMARTIFNKTPDKIQKVIDQMFMPVFCIVILFLSTSYLANDSFNPFLYFRF